MTTIAAYAAGQDDPSPGTRRIDAANQREAWLRQMELAQLAGMGGTPIHAAPSAPPPARAAAGTLAPSAAQVANRPAAPDGVTGAGSVQERAPSDAAYGPGASAAGADTAAKTRPVGDVASASTVATAANAAARPLHADAARPDDAVAEVAAAPSAALAALALPAQTATATSADILQSATPAVTPVSAAVALQRVSLPVARTAQAPAPHAGPEEGEAPDWQKRVMHLTGDGDDVQLWIRDGELSPSQTRQLVARLAGDVAAMGLRLKEATVNGKPALRARTDTEPDAFVTPITHPTTER